MPDQAAESVTVVVTRRVRRGQENAYEDWLRRLLAEAALLPGYLGANIQRPAPGATVPEYTSVFRFDSVAHLRAFEQSDLRQRYLQEVVDYVEADATWQRLTGLEFWFTPPPGVVVPQPSRWRMALLLVVVVYGLVLSIGQVVAAVLGSAPAPVRLLVTIVLEVLLMTYVLMPRLTKALARWIYPAPRPVRGADPGERGAP
jgi:hypothetical protein